MAGRITTMKPEFPPISNPIAADPSRYLLWPIAIAAGPLLGANTAPHIAAGYCGSFWLSTTAAPIYADLLALTLPGLSALGIDTVVTPPAEGMALFEEREQRTRIAVFGFDGEPFVDVEDEDDAAEDLEVMAAGTLAARDRERTLVRSGLVISATVDGITWQDGFGVQRTESPSDFRARFTRIVLMRPGAERATRRSGMVAAINRGVQFALAYPDRFLSACEADEGRRDAAATFLAEAAGKQRDPVSLRWRQAAERMAAGNIGAALDRLYDSLLRGLSLPETVYHALAQREGESMTSPQRRELIYLARAGHRDLKILAAHKLAFAVQSTDVRLTLEQLSRAPDPLVRATAAQGLSADYAFGRPSGTMGSA